MEKKEKNTSNINIRVKSSNLAEWKSNLKINDFEIFRDINKNYKLVEIKQLAIPRGNDREGTASIKYLNKKSNTHHVKKIKFKFVKTEYESYRQLQVSKNDFVISSDILTTFNFLDFGLNDITCTRPEVEITKVRVFSWNLFDQKIALKLTLLVKEVETSFFVEYPLRIDILKLVFNLLEFDAENSFLTLNDDLKFVPQKITILTPDAYKYFNEKELMELKKIVEEIKFFDVRVKHDSGQVNMFDKNSIGSFVGSIKIRDRIFKNIVIFAKYDASIAINKIKKILQDFSLVHVVKGAPRDLELQDIYTSWNKMVQNKIFYERGFENFVADQVEITTKNINVEESEADVEITLKNSPTKEKVWSKTLRFEVSLLEELQQNEGNDIIYVNAKHKLETSPKITNFEPEDFASKNEAFKVLKIKPLSWNDSQVYDYNRSYFITVRYNDRVTFEFKKRIDFKISHADFEFENLNTIDVQIAEIQTKPAEYFQNLMNQESIHEEWIEIDVPMFKTFALASSYKYLDFKFKNSHFKRVDFTKEGKIELRILVKSYKLEKEKYVYHTFNVDVEDMKIIFKNLNSERINIKNKNIFLSLPQYKLNLMDFRIDDPYRFTGFTFQNNISNNSVKCIFSVKFLDAYKSITKYFYYGELKSEVINNDEINSLFSKLGKKDLTINFDPESAEYDVMPTITATVTEHPQIFVEVIQTNLKNRKGKMQLQLLLRFGHNAKIIKTSIKYSNPISQENFLNYKKQFKLIRE